MFVKQLSLLFSFACCTVMADARCTADSFSIYKQPLPNSPFAFTMVPIPAGDFRMGSTDAADEQPVKTIRLSAFWMGAYEVTRDELDVFLKDASVSENSDMDAITRPSPQYVDLTWGMGKEGGFPANSMSQRAALMYCRWLYQKTGVFYRLPTEAEWEYACRAGSTGKYFFGDDSSQLKDYAWFAGNSDNSYHKVGQKKPNAWGLYDMLGNLLEWTMDQYSANAYTDKPDRDPMVAASSLTYPKVLRGGGYTDIAGDMRSAKRFHSDPSWNKRDPQIPKSKWWLTEAMWVGFRLVRPKETPSREEIEKFFEQYLGS